MTGSVEPGKYADIVAFEGKPLEDAAAYGQCRLVMKGENIYKSVIENH